MHLLTFAYAAPDAAAAGATNAPAQPNPILAFAPILVMFVVFYFLLIRPQQKRQQQLTAMVNNLKKGDKVVTNGGIIGVVVGLKDNQVVLKVGDGDTKIEFVKSAVVQVLPE